MSEHEPQESTSEAPTPNSRPDLRPTADGSSALSDIPPETESPTASVDLDSPDTVNYLGAELTRATVTSQFTPDPETYSDYIEDAFTRELQRDIAIAWAAGEPMLIEGGTSIGKTTTVKKMASELGYEVHYINLTGMTDPEALMGRYIPNVTRASPDEPEYTFADGPITAGLRQEDGKRKIIIVDEINAARPEVLIRLHEVLDGLERNGSVTLTEDASESIATSHQLTKIIGLANPPGKGYTGREPLDPAQLRRWVYKKAPSELPTESLAIAGASLFGLNTPETSTLDAQLESLQLTQREARLTPEGLAEIPGMPEVLDRFLEFHRSAKALLTSRDIGADQPQRFSFDDRMEPRRVRDFIASYYNGDITETIQMALKYFYVNKVESHEDRAKLEELIGHVAYTPESDSRRQSVPPDDESANNPDEDSDTDSDSPAESPEPAKPKPLFEAPVTDIESLPLSPETKELAEKLELFRQYCTQMDVLIQSGVAEYRYSTEVIIRDINGIEQYAPTYAEVLTSLEANREIVAEKAKQGFTELLMVPFGMPLAKLTEAYGSKLIEAHTAGELTSSDGTKLDLDTDTPVWLADSWYGAADVEGRIVYYPTSFSKKKHGGKTKSALLTAPKSSWDIQLVEGMVDIPAAGEATITAGRTRPMAGKSPAEYLLDIQTYLASGQYAHESGLTPEAWLTLALTRLHTRRQVIDDWLGSGKADYLLGAYNPTTGYLPDGYWGRDSRRAGLGDVGPDYVIDNDGFRPSVRLKT